VRILVIGGTRFVGRTFVEAAVAGGHDVTLFHRGRTGADAFPQARHLLGDRDLDLSALAEGEWDATVDVCGYFPRQVHGLADALGGRGGHHLFVSSVSAYAEPPAPGITEDAPLAGLADEGVQEVTAETYGGLKAVCERVAVQRHGVSTLLVRPTYVVGPWDHTGRFTYWVRRIARGGDVLVPGPADQAVQVVDGRDMGAWMVKLLASGESGAFHAATPPPPFTMGDLVESVAAAVAPAGTRLVWADAEWLAAQRDAGPTDGATDGTADGPETRDWWPLWNGGVQEWAGNVDPAAAYRTGLDPRPLAQTVPDTLDHPGTPEVEGVAPTAEREAELLAAWSARR
jgi:2'-hydroxyisoflavone reductase